MCRKLVYLSFGTLGLVAFPWLIEHALLIKANGAAGGDAVLESKGYIVPVRQVSVGPNAAGQVVEMHVEEGQVVKKGDIVARLEATKHATALRYAQAKLTIAKARYDKIKGYAARPDLLIAEAEIEAAQAKVEAAKWRLDATIIRAPIAGTVLYKKCDVGSFVSPMAYQVYPYVCELADLHELEVDVAVQERDLAKVFKGQACQVIVEAHPEIKLKGRVSRLMPVADRAKGALPVRVRLDVPAGDHPLRPEMAAIVQFLAKD